MSILRYYVMPGTTFVGALGFVIGGNWIWLAAATYVILMAIDVILPSDTKARNFKGPKWQADLPLYLQAPAMIALYAAFLWWVTHGFNAAAPFAELQVIGAVLGIGWLSAVPTLPIAHELWHRRHWFPRLVARLIGTFYMDPAKDVGHNLGHHIYIGTSKDADTPERGQSIYRFVVKARLASWRDTFNASAESLRRRGRSPWNIRNVSYQQILLPIALAIFCFAIGGPLAGGIAVASMVAANFYMEGLNYMQHYGQIRTEDEDIQLHHAWNHLGAVVRPLGCEITNHINHHKDSYIRFEELEAEPEAPQMPSLFVCFLAGLVPPVWQNFIAKPRLREWDNKFATPEERAVAREVNKRIGWPDWFEDDKQGDSPSSQAA